MKTEEAKRATNFGVDVVLTVTSLFIPGTDLLSEVFFYFFLIYSSLTP